jgi:hypothetical protein
MCQVAVDHQALPPLPTLPPLPSQGRDYTLPAYCRLLAALRKKAEQLGQHPSGELSGVYSRQIWRVAALSLASTEDLPPALLEVLPATCHSQQIAC